jgi:hypothetical protein
MKESSLLRSECTASLLLRAASASSEFSRVDVSEGKPLAIVGRGLAGGAVFFTRASAAAASARFRCSVFKDWVRGTCPAQPRVAAQSKVAAYTRRLIPGARALAVCPDLTQLLPVRRSKSCLADNHPLAYGRGE